MLLQFGDAVLDPVWRDELAGKRRERLGEKALPAIALNNAGIEAHAAQRRGNGGGRNAVSACLLTEAIQPSLEIAGVAAVGVVWRGRLGLFGGRRQQQSPGPERRPEPGPDKASQAKPTELL